MSDSEEARGGGSEMGVNQKELSAEEKKQIAEAKNERRLAKLQEKGPEAVAAAELRKQRLKEREEAKKERVREKKAKLAAAKALENGGAAKGAGKRKQAGSSNSNASEDGGTKKAKRSGPTAFELSVAAHAARLPWGGIKQPVMSVTSHEGASLTKPQEESKTSGYNIAPSAKPAAVNGAAPAAATATTSEVGAPVKLSRRQLAAAKLAEQNNAKANSYETYGQQDTSSWGGSSSKSYGASRSIGVYGPGSSSGGDPYAPNGGGGGGGYGVAEARARQLAEARNLRLEAPYEVFLKYLPPQCNEDEVSNFFSGCGEMAPGSPKLMRAPDGRVIRGFVVFTTPEGCMQALSRNYERLGPRSIEISVATTKGTLQAEGTHTPAMYAECVATLGVRSTPNGVFVDGTFGRGGHTKKILEAMGPSGELHAFDMDEEAIAAGKVLASQDKRFHIHYSPFSAMFQVLTQPGVAKGSSPEGNFVDGVLIDIGISSPQLDGSRGFRPEDTYDSPLDMRFDQRPHVESALQFVQRVGRHQLASCIEHYGGEHPLAARRIADAIALAKANGSLPTRTAAFGALVANAKGHEYQAMHPAKMTFQALRIQVNKEYDELRGGLEASMKLLKDGGKTAVLTWKHTECAILVDHARRHEVAMPNAPLRKWVELNLGKKTFLSAKAAAPYLKLSNESAAASSPVGETEVEAKTRRKKEKKEKKEKKAMKKEKAEKKDDEDDEEEADEFFYLKLPPKEAGVVVEEAKRPSEAEVKMNSRSRSAVLHSLRRETGVRMAALELASAPHLGWDPYPAAKPVCEPGY